MLRPAFSLPVSVMRWQLGSKHEQPLPTMPVQWPRRATTVTALAIAETCYRTMLAEGFKAKAAVERKVVTEAVECIVEANTYLSGIGFESGGLAAAHSVHNGLSAVADTHSMYHGKKVSFGVLVQLVLENASLEEIETVCSFCVELGLPVTLA